MPPSVLAKKTLTLDEVSARLQITKATVYSRIHQRILNPIKVSGRTLFSIDDVIKEEERIASLTVKKRGVKPLSLSRIKEIRKEPSVVVKDEKPKTTSPPDLPSTDLAGQISSKAAKLFDEGKSVRNVVIELCITFAFAKQLYEDYKSCGPELHLTPEIVVKLRKRLNWVENPPTPEGLIRAIDEYATFLAENIKKETRKNIPPTPPTPALTTSSEKVVERVLPDNIAEEIDFGE